MADVLREPIVSPILRRKFIQDDIPPGPLLRGVNPIFPPGEISDGFAVRRRYFKIPDPVPNLALRLFVPKPFQTPEWPVITRRRDIPFAESGPNLALRLIVAAPPFVPVEWPQPYRQKQAHQPLLAPRPWNAGPPAAPQVAPFAQYEWPAPFRFRSAQAAQEIETVFIDSSPPPFAPLEFPTPYRKRQAITFDPPNLARFIQPPAAPFIPVEFPTPRRARIHQNYEQPNTVFTLALQPAQLPFRLFEWPQPFRRRPAYDVHLTYRNSQIPNAIPAVPTTDTYFEVVPYLIGQTEDSARFMLTQVHLVPNVIGSGGVVQSQTIDLGTLVPRGTVIMFTMGGTPNNGRRNRSRGQPPYNSGIA